MPPKGPSRQELTWSWAYSTRCPASDQNLEAAANAAWPYALLCAWTYLSDRDAAHDMMDHAVQNLSNYIDRHPGASPKKLIARIKSVLRRRAKQLAAGRSRELQFGSLLDLERIYSGQPEAEQRVYANEMFARLSPFARSIVNLRWYGYSWREIARQLEMDHTAVRRAYLREIESMLRNVSRPGEFPQCD